MASDYERIRKENLLDYGRQVGRLGRLVANLYSDSTHFIFELLQNAEDALRRRSQPKSRTVKFDLAAHALCISHYGEPFDEDDVKGICDIGEGTKAEDDIGQFGIGFKSVYRFTDRPQIHSGNEDFGIDNYVWPSIQDPICREADETVFVLPLKDPAKHHAEIAEGLRDIGLDTLLFLHEIDTIEWCVSDHESGVYVRQSEDQGSNVRRVTLIGNSKVHGDAESSYLVFSDPSEQIEIAFRMEDGRRIVPIGRSPLVVFFPTVLETHLGFLAHGPYLSTPTRDNIQDDTRNLKLVEKTGDVLVEAILWFRDQDMLNLEALLCLPIDQDKFDGHSMFNPIFRKTKELLRKQRVLPAHGHCYAIADEIRITRSGDLRKIFTPTMLGEIFGERGSLYWISEEITERSAPGLVRYIRDVLNVDELRPLNVIRELGADFLERQNNEWVRTLYEFMNAQTELRRQAKEEWPLVRLSDGSHVIAYINGRAQAYLPGTMQTDFPTVHHEASSTADARQFLEAIDLTLPDSVDDIIQNVLSRYKGDLDVDDVCYGEDIARIVDAFRTDSSSRREELVDRLSETAFLCAVDTAGHRCWATPREVYFKTDRLASLFEGVGGVLFVDPSYDCLRGETARSMLGACGASRYLRPKEVDCTLSYDDLKKIRRNAGLERMTWDKLKDQSLHGVQELLYHMARLCADERRDRATTLWDALSDVAAQTPGAFLGNYTWGYSHDRKTENFDAETIRFLNTTAWVPSDDGDFRVPSEVSFGKLGWRSEPLLLSKISFRPAEVDQLAEKVDIDADVLYLLKQYDLTSVAAFRERLGLTAEEKDDETNEGEAVDGAIANLGVATPFAPSIDNPNAIDNERDHGTDDRVGGRRGSAEAQTERGGDGSDGDRRLGTVERGTVSHNAAIFHSYVAVDHEEGRDPDGIVHEERMALEEVAIELILRSESHWQRTPSNNEGFDLVQVSKGQKCKWCEVKAMTGSLHDRPATMSHAQFKCAQKHGDAYWLYVVERAGSADARIMRIQDPVGKAKTFTFDKGWLGVAEVD